MPGTVISPVEVVQVSRFGIWLAVDTDEHFLDYKYFPWFRKAAIDEICEVEMLIPGHFFWPKLDIDLDIDCILNPGSYPLIST
ncbi:MAG: hypothetical protein A2Z99_14710 [Treponema sp. GWB1_62_6]|nr:MAG: hypothetical protein A2Y36_15325 [Treponema sp. GWA1_62_8]OHE66831.1 MAG: hypothetical protein A2Z99_14710 [Treponema sp. GWB1_62_6]OHE73432.1 MAG: hypothetical protein A2413_03610 [Treponema sp. RIFOXYC1_FULL_61_9]HCM25096.1 DUF2442 domain-containing protein [Treponema sp.]